MNNIDESVVALLRKGSLEAMEMVYTSLFDRVYLYARSYTGNDEQAKEICQESFLALWERREQLRPDSNLQSYLLQTARNKSLNWLRRQQSSRNWANDLQYRKQAVSYEALKDKTAELVLLQELETLIAKTLEELPEPCRMVFQMSRAEKMSYAEIAERLDVSIKTIEHRMMQALRLFRKNLSPYLPLFSALFY